MRKRALSRAMVLTLTLSLCLSLTVPAKATTVFPDVSPSHWAYDEIQKCCSQGIVKGHSDGTFKPEDSVTGAEFATMLARTFYPAELASNNFLASQAWYLPALTTAYNVDMLSNTSRLASGQPSGWSSTANLPLSRYDMAQMLSNVLVDKGITTSSDQKNASKSTIEDWSKVPNQYQNAVLSCYALGILRGMSDGSFSGSSTMKRSEACAVINRELSCIGGGTSTAPTTPSGSSDSGTQETLDFSDSYKSSKYYTALKAVTLTGDYRQDIINIAASQVGYHESDKENQLDGSANGNSNYSEYGRALGSNGSAWCSEFASWCIRQAGVPTDIIRSSRSASVSTFNAPYYSWSQTSYAGGSYTPQPGDLALFAWSGTKLTDPYLSHTAIVSGVKQEGGKVQLSVIHGNSSDAVRRSVYTIDSSTGKCSGGQLGYFVSPNYGPSSVQNYDPGQSTQAPTPEPVINLSQTSVILEAGKSSTLTASTNQTSAKITYTSGNSSVVRVDQNGRITALKAGTVPVIASVTANGHRATAQCVVTVTAPGTSAQLKIYPETLSLKTGEIGSVKATLTGGTAAVSYSSGSQSVATVDASGKVTAKAAGTAVITASATVGGRKLTAVCTVTVTAAQSKTPQQLASEVVTLVNQERAKQGLSALGTLGTLTAAAEVRAPEVARVFSHTRPDGRSFSTVLGETGVTNYYTAGENIASGQRTPEAVMNSWMNSSGHKANILNKDFTHIGVAYYNGAWVQVFIGSTTPSEGASTQRPNQQPSVTISPSTLNLEVGKTGSLQATTSNTTARVVYTSSNQSIAVVSSSGTVTAKAAGTAVITASVTASGKTYSAQCTVTVKAAQPAKTPQQLASEVVTLVNQERAKQGLSALGTLGTLTAAAEVRAPEVARVFSHTRPDGRSFSTVLGETGVTNYYTAGENIASGQRTPEAVMNSWMNSSGHKANILNKDFTHIGVAYYNGAWVQVFIGSNSSGSQSGTPVQSINPGSSQAVRSSLPADRITKHYREDWPNGDYFEISVSGNTLSFSGRYTTSTARSYSHVLLKAFGYNNEVSVPFVNGEEFHLQVTIDMNAFTAHWNQDPRPLSIITAMPVSNYTPGASSFSGVHYQAAADIRLALDSNNELAVYVRD